MIKHLMPVCCCLRVLFSIWKALSPLPYPAAAILLRCCIFCIAPPWRKGAGYVR